MSPADDPNVEALGRTLLVLGAALLTLAAWHEPVWRYGALGLLAVDVVRLVTLLVRRERT